ncbi:MAG: hypothetical protein HC822_05625, partial [Oscillochloris sp.]|nr:hypothetical protein [Oscillochloris sp.]
MTVLSTSPAAAARNAGPSLYKLVAGLPDERRMRQPADALVIIGRQLELVMQDQGLEAHVAIGTLRFSLFRLHQGRIAQLVPHCRSITVYGEADVEPPKVPGVEFVALPHGSPLTQEWFLVIDSPYFWGALLTQAVPDRTNGNMRRYLFDGALSADERIVNRANLLLSLVSRRPAPDVGVRYAMANRAHWALVAYQLATHGESERLNLAQSLSELPELAAISSLVQLPNEDLLPQAIFALQHYTQTPGHVLYHVEGPQLNPVVWSTSIQPPVLDRHTGLLGRALDENAPVMAGLTGADQEHSLLPGANSAVAVPLLVSEQPWGVLLVGMNEADPHETPTTAAVIGVAALLEQILSARSHRAKGYAVPAPPSAGFTPPMPGATPADAWGDTAECRPYPTDARG